MAVKVLKGIWTVKYRWKNWPHLEIDPRTPLDLPVLRGERRDYKVSGLIN